MMKSIVILCLTLSIASIALGQEFDQAAMKKFSDLISKINTTLSQQCFLTIGVDDPLGCAKKYQDKYVANITNIAKDIGDAATNGNLDRMTYLSKQLVYLSCCGSWSMLDCMTGIAKNCSQTDQDNLTKLYTKAASILEGSMCKDFKYHSNQCSNPSSTATTISPTTTTKSIDQSNINRIISGLIGKLETQLGSNVGEECGQTLQSGAQVCLISAQVKYQTSDNSRVVRNTCCGAWYVRDCVTNVGKKCNQYDQANIGNILASATKDLEGNVCSNKDFYYHSSECNGSSIISINSTMFALLLIYVFHLFRKY